MHSKDYSAIARTLNTEYKWAQTIYKDPETARATILNLAQQLTKLFHQQNPRFSPDKFIKVVKGE